MDVWNSYVEQSEIDYEIYMLISKNYATLKELQEEYDVDDILDMMEILYLKDDLEAASYKDQELRMKNNP